MERVTDNFLQDARDCMSSNLQMMLDELYERRRDEELGHAGPIPCTVGFDNWTMKRWFQKINEELDELKLIVTEDMGDALDCPMHMYASEDDASWKSHIAEEAADVITVVTSMLEAMGIGKRERQEAQRRVNKRNRERGRIAE